MWVAGCEPLLTCPGSPRQRAIKWVYVCMCDAAVANGHGVSDAVAARNKLLDEQRLQAERLAQMELIRQQMEEERERKRAIIAEVSPHFT